MSDLHVLEFMRDPDGAWNLPAEHVARLREEFPQVRLSSPADVAAAERVLPEADVVLGWLVRPANFASARRLRWIHVSAAGVNSLMFPELVESPVVVTNGRGLYGVAMAEHTLGVMLALARKLHLARDAQGARRWEQDAIGWTAPPIRELAGATLGLVGFGTVGTAIAERARAFGMRVVAVRRHPAPEPAPAHDQWGIDSLPRLLEESDWVVLAAPLTAATRGLIGPAEIGRMKPDAVLVNLGRGRLVDEAALVAALRAGRIGGAALDVFEHEPLPAESPLWDLPQVILTPHVSGMGPRFWERAIGLFRGNLRCFLDGAPLVNVVDKRAGY